MGLAMATPPPGSQPHEVHRAHLLGLLAATPAQIVVLAAAAGYGKTTLLAQHARQLVRQPVVWLRLRPDHADVRALIADLVSAVQMAHPGAAFGHWQAVAGQEMTFAGLARAVAQDLDTLAPSALLLDRTEHLGPEAWQWLAALLDELTVGHRFVVAGYDTGTLPVARLVAGGRALVLTSADLAFTPDETQAYFHDRHAQPDAHSAHTALDGWPAGLALAVHGQGANVQPENLIWESLDRLPAEVRANLAELAPFDPWDEQLAVALEIDLPPQWLQMVVHAGLPVRAVGGRRYEPHTLLKDCLEIELKARPNRHAALHREAASDARKRGQPLEALQHLLTADQLHDAVAIAEEVIPLYVQSYAFNLMRSTLELFDKAQLTDDLQIALAQAWIHTGASDKAALVLHQLVNQGVQRPRLHNLLALLAYHQGRTADQIQHAETGLSLNPPDRLRTSLEIMRSSGLEDLGDFEAGLTAAEQAVQAAERSQSPFALSDALTSIATSYARADRRDEARRTFHQALQLSERIGQKAKHVEGLNNLANYLADWGQLEEAFEMANRGVALARQAGGVWIPILLGTRGLLQVRRGRYAACIEDCLEAAELCPSFGLDAFACNYFLWAAQCQAHLGQLVQTRSLIDRAAPLVPEGSDMHGDIQKLTLAVGAMHSSNLDAAQQALQGITLTVVAWDNARKLALLAELARRSGKLTRRHVAQLIQAIDAAETDQVLATDLPLLHGLYAECVRRGWFAERFAPFAARPGAEACALRLTTIDKFGVTVNEEPVHVSLKKSQELLAWLAVHGASTREEIIRALWDDTGDQRHAEYFKVALRQLRKDLLLHPAIGFDPIVYERRSYSLNGQFCVRTDVAFSGELREAELEPWLGVYQGTFLPESESAWVQEFRLTLHDRIAEALWQLGRSLAGSAPDRAMALYARAAEVNPLLGGEGLGVMN